MPVAEMPTPRAVAPEPVVNVPAPPAIAPVPLLVVVNEAPPPPPDAPPAEPPEEVEGPPPAPQAEEPAQDGNGEGIARAIAAEKRAAVRSCFERELKEQPKLTGTVVVELDLAPPARVEAVRVSDDLNRPGFTRCVTAAMQGVRFAMLDEEISVRVPYVLSPERRSLERRLAE
ncbi:MAG: AgmX/PglI C-terminal domain-containing protein [Myxococcales bacterium]|nr:AgmX/PglI C-terminal domain-containing protein [Myxococcales bacterium]